MTTAPLDDGLVPLTRRAPAMLRSVVATAAIGVALVWMQAPSPAAADPAPILRSVSLMEAIRDVCPPLVATDRARAEAYALAFRDVASNSIGQRAFGAAIGPETDRRRAEIRSATPGVWCAAQRASLVGMGITDVFPEQPRPAPSSEPTSGPSDAAKPSRSAERGHVWKTFEAPRLGLELLIQEAIDPAERYRFTEREEWLEQHRGSDETTFASSRLIRVMRKAAEQPIEAAIAEAVSGTVPAEGRSSCRVRPTEPRIDLGPGKMTFEVVPTGAYGRRIEAELRQRPRDFGCGPYGKGQSTSYFEYHPAENPTVFLYVDAGADLPLFDERSIRVLPSAASTARPPDGASANAALQVWSVAMNRANDGSTFCEASAKGRDPGFGLYGIRYRPTSGRPGAPAILIVTHATPLPGPVGTVAVKLDGRTLGTVPAKPIMLGSERALFAEIDGRRFAAEVVTEFEKPEARLAAIEVAGRSFQIPVAGYAAVVANLEACRREL